MGGGTQAGIIYVSGKIESKAKHKRVEETERRRGRERDRAGKRRERVRRQKGNERKMFPRNLASPGERKSYGRFLAFSFLATHAGKSGLENDVQC